jgi:predicted nucleic acid-binding protein
MAVRVRAVSDEQFAKLRHRDYSLALAKGRGQLQAQGIVRSAPDMLVAATALEHQLIVATRNTRDFLNCALQLVDPFEPVG